MACNVKSSSIFLEASSVTFGKEQKTCIELVTGLVGGEHLLVSNSDTDFYMWFTVDSVGVDPAVAGRTAIQVDLPAAYTTKQAADLIKAAVESDEVFYGNVCTDTLCVQLVDYKIGEALNAPSDVDTGFTISVEVAGSKVDLGKTKEAISVNFEVSLLDIISNQTGPNTPIDKILQGTSASMEMSLLEVSKERLELLIGEGYGDIYTGAAESLVGFGTSKNFKSSFDQAGRLVLHPLRLDASDRSEDVTFWSTVCEPSSINYDGNDTKALSATFNALIAEDKPEEISVFAVGDTEQFLA